MVVATRRTNGFCYGLKLTKIMELKAINRLFPNIPKLFGINCHLRYYSRYPKYYIEPMVDKEEIKEVIKNKDPLEIELLHIKAAENFVTCSAFFDADLHLLSRYLMRNGNSTLANDVVSRTMNHIKRVQLEKYYKHSPGNERDSIELDPKKIFHKAVENCTPVLSTKKIIRSGTSYVIPTVVLPKRAKFLAMKYILDAAQEKQKTERIWVSLAKELIAASQNEGTAVQKKTDLHKYCEANRAYAHYRWG